MILDSSRSKIDSAENTRFVHEGCKGSKGNLPAKDADAVPARFLMACRNGHLDDFPWHYFVHSGPSDCKGTLRFFESGASLQTENLWVKCDECGASRSMAHAFGKVGKENLPQCRGRHPHLDRYDDDCGEQARAVLLGATNSWFPITLSALAIPLSRDPISQLVQDGWDYFEDVDSEAGVLVIKTLKNRGPFRVLINILRRQCGVSFNQSGMAKRNLRSQKQISKDQNGMC